jgi:hypothetical protein
MLEKEDSLARRIVLTFVDEGISAVAELLEDQAPKTCAAVLAALPQENEAHHATYSGSEVAYILDRDLGIGKENATSKVIPGDVAYTRFEGGEMWGFPDSFSELCWFYDRDAVPSMPDGPVPVNIFARIVEGLDEFASACRGMRRTGVKVVRVSVE